MLEIMRRRKSLIRPAPAGRWARWARSISDGHHRVVSRHRGLVMELLRLTAPFYFSSHRWELNAWSLFPQIKLAIAPLLREFGARRSSLFVSGAARTQLLRIEPLTGGTTVVMRSAVSRKMTTPAQRDVGDVGEALTTGSLTATGLIQFERPVVSELEQPLSRIFRRVESNQREVQLGRTLLTRESLILARRVTSRSHRVEHHSQRTTVVRRQQSARNNFATDPEMRGGPENRLASFEAWRDAAKEAAASQPMVVPPTYSIEQLTDQVMRRIDDRVVAHKERMGKLF